MDELFYFSRQGIEDAIPAPMSALWTPNRTETYWDGSTLVQRLQFPSYPTTVYGAPAEVWQQVSFGPNKVYLTYDLMNKSSTRMPEAFWITFNGKSPKQKSNSTKDHWWMTKLDRVVSPLDVMRNGSQAQHAISGNNSFFYGPDPTAPRLIVNSIDCPVVSPIRYPFPYVYPLNPSQVSPEMSVLVFANMWLTNYQSWYPLEHNSTNIRGRFSIEIS